MTTKKMLALLVATFALSTSAVACGGEEIADDEAEGSEDAIVAAERRARIETFKGVDNKHYFHLVAANGEIVLQSEAYERTSGAQNGIRSVLENGVREGAFELRTASGGEHYAVLKAGNGEIIANTEMYSSRSNAQRAIETSKRLVRQVRADLAREAAKEPKFESFTGEDRLEYFHLRAGNGQIVLQSEGYSTASNARRGVRSVRMYGADRRAFEVLEAADGQFYFRLKAPNGEIIGRSETYVSRANAERGRDTVVDILERDVAR